MLETVMSNPGLMLVLVLVLGAEFVNGATDAPNAIATVVSTRVLRPMMAVLVAVLLNVWGAFTGTAVALTIAKGILDPSAPITLTTVGAAMTAIIIWSSLAWRFGIPTSESHALVAGLAGAGLAAAGPGVLVGEGWRKVLIGLMFSTFLGFGFGHFIIVSILWICRRFSPSTVRRAFGRLQILSAAFMAFGHGSNDGQKFMGAFVLAIILGGAYPQHLMVDNAGDSTLTRGTMVSPDEVKAATANLSNDAEKPKTHLVVPHWVILVCALIMGVGTSVGGWRIIRTMGISMVKLEPYHGFAAETAAAGAIQLASALSIPLSTTHTINTAIMGVGAARRFSAVRWGVAGEIVAAWVLTFPVCGAIAFLVAFLFDQLGRFV
jgi:PiT family inorganic phosphate transporter